LFTTRGVLDTSGVHKNIIAQILSEMDGLIEMENVFVLGATNRPDLLDPALMRPGRFDEIIEIPRPGHEAGAKILDIYLRKGLPIDKALVEEHGGYDQAHGKLIDFVLEELYAPDRWVEMKVDSEAKEAVKTVKKRDIVSGAIIEAIVKTAKKNFVKRVIAMPAKKRSAAGLTQEDLRLAIEEECKEHAITEIYIYEKRQREMHRTGSDPMVG
ncbi:MAG: ATP-binding protein, partial [Thermoplasmata archaeon]